MDSRRSRALLDQEIVALLLLDELLLGHQVDGLEPQEGVARLFELLLHFLLGDFRGGPELPRGAARLAGPPVFGRLGPLPRPSSSSGMISSSETVSAPLPVSAASPAGAGPWACVSSRSSVRVFFSSCQQRFLEVDEVALDFGFPDLGLDPFVLGGLFLLAGGLEAALEIVLAPANVGEGGLGLFDGPGDDRAFGLDGFLLLREFPDMIAKMLFFGLARSDLLLEGGDPGFRGLLAPGETLDLLAEAVHFFREDVAAGLELEEPPFLGPVLFLGRGQGARGRFRCAR